MIFSLPIRLIFKNKYAEKFIPLNLLDKSYKNISKKVFPEVIIHCGAITDVDFCEKNKKKKLSESMHYQ